jgi:hypothetical protein
MSDKHHVWISPPPTWYEGIPIGIPLEPTLEFSFSTPKLGPILFFTDVSGPTLKKDLSGLTFPFTYNIP